MPVLGGSVQLPGGLELLGAPDGRPVSIAAASPALVRSRIKSRSNSARATKTWKTSLPPGGGGVAALGEAAEGHPPGIELLDGVDEVSEAAAEALEPPDDDRIPVRNWSSSAWRAGRWSRLPEACSVKMLAAACFEGVVLLG